MRSCQSVPILVGNDSMDKSSFGQRTQHLCRENPSKLDTVWPLVTHVSLYVFMMVHATFCSACSGHRYLHWKPGSLKSS